MAASPTRRFNTRRSRPLLNVLSLGAVLLALPGAAHAHPWSARATASAAMMLSHDQLKELEYDGAGFIGNVAVSRELISRLSLQWSARGGTFLSKQQIGGLVGTLLGLRLHPTERDVMPYLSVDVGMAVTGADVRPWVGGAVGIDCRINERWQAGPVAGVDDVIQWNGEAYSTDAMFLWFGLGFSYRTRRARRQPPPPASTHTVVHTREVVQVPSEPEPGETLVLEHLIERALGPSQRVELLAPVLFALDSDQLEPVGVAMLHEVAHTLATRPELLLLEVQGYADARGSDARNRALSQRRAARVRDWLIEHGVAPDRLTIAPQGESAPVESDESESAYQQNRRVVFRVLELAEP